MSDQIFSLPAAAGTNPAATHQRCTAAELGLKEAWFRDAIFEQPLLAIAPCEQAGLTDDDWYPWAKEFSTAAGPIDVLLVSSGGRVAVVETKLASNPENRRKVLVQALDYLSHLSDALRNHFPPIPRDASDEPVAERDEVMARVADGDGLVVIASDDVDDRVERLSKTVFGDQLLKQWKLALVDLALFRPTAGGTPVVLPVLRGAVTVEARQVVRVIVQGETPATKIVQERQDLTSLTPGRQAWDEERFFATLAASPAPATVKDLAARVRDLVKQPDGDLALDWGTGQNGSMTLKRNGAGLLEIYVSGKLGCRPRKFVRALGAGSAVQYQQELEALLPDEMKDVLPRVEPKKAGQVAERLGELLERILDSVESR
ncbi:MAG: hypothetical protein KA371_12130 [Acidobacteria bacterium]|nr:hypothetical protein [Acidobacteriota bacterium]